ncbi:MAG: flagellar biosynthesis protein FlhF [Chloroherpetonaceae bacterium]|nr:flagellar biosynthesis protein FlhF [Chthonomonadaceae bacterium]MDW8207226.1 flagellar biosynthesis protein FlhF [Chloroherpetonaceae bacterium]
MQIKEFEAYSLKDCLQQVREVLGPEAVILETRKFRKGGLLGFGARDAVCVVAATGITVKNDVKERAPAADAANTEKRAALDEPSGRPVTPSRQAAAATPAQAAAIAAARNAYARKETTSGTTSSRLANGRSSNTHPVMSEPAPEKSPAPRQRTLRQPEPASSTPLASENQRLDTLERAMQEIRESLLALKQAQQEAHERTLTAVVSAVAPTARARTAGEGPAQRLPELHRRLRASGISETLTQELLAELPDLSAWREEAQQPLAESALRDLLTRRIHCAGPIVLTPGTLKAVALIGPTGVGKTTTIAKLAAHFALVERKKVALLTVDTYRIAAVEQLKTYSQIIDIPVAVAYSPAEVLPAIQQFADYDLLLVDTAGRSQKNIMQVGELKAMLEMVRCETHLVLSALIKTEDMLEAARRFSAARVDRLLFSKLDETGTYGTLFEVADQTGIPLSYLTTGQKVPEDIETADPATLVNLILG